MEKFDFEEELKKLPGKPGVYIMHDSKDAIIYVGKAVSLKNRVRSYFRASTKKTPKIQKMVSLIARFEYIVTDSELEALVLENNLIKEHSPKYNTMLKDDKTYPYIKVTISEPFPRILFARQMKKDRSKYFGPYTSAAAVKDTIELMNKLYKLRTCNRSLPQDIKKGRPCLNYHIKQCFGPCQGYISEDEYRTQVNKAMEFLNGNYGPILKELEEKMYAASEALEFEEAAKIKELLYNSIEAHKVADVEVGSFLSSGVDSSFIATASNVDKTFTVGWDNKNYSEIDYAKELSEMIEVENISKKISKKEYFDNFANIQYYMDEPLADPSAIALYFVANIASKNVKVALSGEGADEIFGGYNIYHEPYSVSWYYKVPYFIRRLLGILVYPLRHHRGFNFIYRRSRHLEDRYVGNAFMFEPSETKKILSYKTKNTTYKDLTKKYYDKAKDYDEVTKMQYLDINMWLMGDILLKADKTSMANSLELRVPFLDKDFIDIILIITNYWMY